MNTPDATLLNQTIVCVSCQHQNVNGAKFCGGCGQGLFEPCSGCGQPTLLNQKFCEACGVHLEKEVEAKQKQLEDWLSLAQKNVEEYHYDEALSLLVRVMDHSDQRFSSLVDEAQKAHQSIQQIAAEKSQEIEEVVDQANKFFDSRDHRQVIRLLTTMPEVILSEKGRSLLAKSQAIKEQSSYLKAQWKTCLESHDWTTAGHTLQQLLELFPEKDKYKKLSEQVASKLLKAAHRRLAKHLYDEASEKLSAIPEIARNDTYHGMLKKIQTLQWLSKQFFDEPYATPCLQQLSLRYRNESPQDTNAESLFTQISKRIKKGPSSPKIAYSILGSSQQSWLGGDVATPSLPKNLTHQEVPELAKHPGIFGVALGLALQGIGSTRIDSLYGEKKGMLSSLRSRNKTACWGIDIGSSGIRAALIRKEKGNDIPIIANVYTSDFEHPCNRTGTDHQNPLMIKKAIEVMLSKIDMTDSSIIASFPSSSIVSRFLRLPPVKDKKATELLRTEASRELPMSLEDLELVTWIAPLSKEEQADSGQGRPAVIAAAKKTLIQSRIDLLGSAGLTVDGLQSDVVAMANFASFEFHEQLALNLNEGDASGDHPAIAIVDGGASATRLIIVTPETYWFWTIDSGGEDLTNVIARITHTTKSEAEKFKRDPSLLEHPMDQFEPAEIKMEDLNRRMKMIFQQTQDKHGPFNVRQTWCLGGSCQTHSWIRRVLLSAK